VSNCFNGAVKATIPHEEKLLIGKFLDGIRELTGCTSIWETAQTYKQKRLWYTLWLFKEEQVDVTGELKPEISAWLEAKYPWDYPHFSDLTPSEAFYVGYTEYFYTLDAIYNMCRTGEDLLLTAYQSCVLHYWRNNSWRIKLKED
jgi:hypothetical protein